MVGTNGSTRNGSLTINGGTFKDVVYLPAYMIYTINGGVFEDIIDVRSGNVTISNGEFKYIGAYDVELTDETTVNFEGYSIDLVANNGAKTGTSYGPTPVLTITGGTFAGKIGLCRTNAEYAYPTVTQTDVTVDTVELGVNAQR